MKAILFFKSFLLLLVIALVIFVATPMDLLTFAKVVAASFLLSILFALLYPEIRGVRNGDIVLVLSSDSTNSITARLGKALNNAKKNSELKIRLSDGTEVIGVLQSYEGFLTPPTAKLLYEEQLVEKWRY
ncbi:MAG: hypothetical protein QXF35_03475 [Candidatus Bilamarchaeaceae archaeon]